MREDKIDKLIGKLFGILVVLMLIVALCGVVGLIGAGAFFGLKEVLP